MWYSKEKRQKDEDMKVELRHLTKTFPGRDRKNGETVTAVDDFSFTVPDGKLIALLDRPGAAKAPCFI